MIVREAFSWIESDVQDNDVAIATRAAPAGGMSNYIVSISAGYENPGTSGLLQLKQGTDVIGSWFVHDVFAMVFPSPIRIDPAKAVSLELAAGGDDGAVSLTGYTA
jgi:hypothetical protein